MGTEGVVANAAVNESNAGQEKVQGEKVQTGNRQSPQGSGQTGANAIKEAAQEAIRKHKLKVDGEEIEVDDEELKRGYSHQKAANKILQEGRAAKKQAEQFVSMMKDKQKLFDAVEKLGHNPKELVKEFLKSRIKDPDMRKEVEEILGEEIKYDLMDPREREFLETKQKLQSHEEREKQRQAVLEQERNDALKAKFAKEYNDQFLESLKNSGLPQNKITVAKMASYVAQAAKLKVKMTADEAAMLVKEDLMLEHKTIIGESDGETLLNLLGDETAAKLLAARGSKIKDPNAELKTPEEQGEIGTRAKSTKKRMTHAQWRAFNRR